MTYLRCAWVLLLSISVQSLFADTISSHPNIVLVLTDDLGFGDVSFLNTESKIKTPHIDSLAAEGVWATDAHSPSSICSPTRYSLLTGRYAWRGKLRRGIVLPWEEPAIEPHLDTLPMMLKRAGYETALIGKWHLGFHWPWKDGKRPEKQKLLKGVRSVAATEMFDWSKPITGGPWAAGFDHYFGDGTINFPPYAFIEDGQLLCEPVDRTPKIGHGGGPSDPNWSYEQVMPVLTQRVVRYISGHRKRKKPYFLLFATTSPHAPHVPTRDFINSSQAGKYGDFVVQTDDAIGQVISALKAAGDFDNTFVIISSDNGPATYVRPLIRSHQHASAGHLRGMKGDTLEGGHRVLFVASWPQGDLAGGRRVDKLISLQDLYATLAHVLNQPIGKEAAQDSINIWPSLKENKQARTEMVHHRNDGRMALRKDHWVYLDSPEGISEKAWFLKQHKIEPVKAPAMLFDLDDDPTERHNLYYKCPEQVRVMQDRLKQLTGTSVHPDLKHNNH